MERWRQGIAQCGGSAEGVEIKKEEGFGLNIADCGIVTVYHPKSGKLLAAHAGRDSLWDRGNILQGKEKRECESVVDAITAGFSPEEKETLQVFVGFGIHPEHFLHPWNDTAHGVDNEKMCRYLMDAWGKDVVFGNDDEKKLGRIDISLLTKRQFEKTGTDSITLFNTIDPFADSRLWSHRRGEKGRNLVLVGYR